MIIGIGCDVLRIHRIENLMIHRDFLIKYFTQNEIKMFENSKKNYIKKIASNFSVKEAFFKAISKKLTTPYVFKDIEVLREEDGSPYINLYGALKIFNELNIYVTISNEVDIVTSFVVISEYNKYIKK